MSKPNATCSAAPSNSVPKDQLRKPLKGFLNAEFAKQGGKSHRLTEVIRTRILLLAAADVGRFMNLEIWLGSQTAVADVNEFVEQVIRRLPESIDSRVAAKLTREKSVSHRGEPSRLKKAIGETEPAETPDRILRMRDSQPNVEPSQGNGETVVKVPLLRFKRTVSKLRKRPARSSKQAAPDLRPALRAVIKTIDRETLVPAAAKGGRSASIYADARILAESLAFDLELAHQQGFRTLQVKMSASYNKAADRRQILEKLKSICDQLRDAMPNRAASVQRIEVYFGSRLAAVLI